MKTIFLSLALMLSMTIHAAQPDTVKVRYIHRLTEDDARIFESNLQKTVIYVNDQVTTHLSSWTSPLTSSSATSAPTTSSV